MENMDSPGSGQGASGNRHLKPPMPFNMLPPPGLHCDDSSVPGNDDSDGDSTVGEKGSAESESESGMMSSSENAPMLPSAAEQSMTAPPLVLVPRNKTAPRGKDDEKEEASRRQIRRAAWQKTKADMWLVELLEAVTQSASARAQERYKKESELFQAQLAACCSGADRAIQQVRSLEAALALAAVWEPSPDDGGADRDGNNNSGNYNNKGKEKEQQQGDHRDELEEGEGIQMVKAEIAGLKGTLQLLRATAQLYRSFLPEAERERLRVEHGRASEQQQEGAPAATTSDGSSSK